VGFLVGCSGRNRGTPVAEFYKHGVLPAEIKCEIVAVGRVRFDDSIRRTHSEREHNCPIAAQETMSRQPSAEGDFQFLDTALWTC
jgi:hypothetical protein